MTKPKKKDVGITYGLLVLLGWVGAHRIYLGWGGTARSNILQYAMAVAFMIAAFLTYRFLDSTPGTVAPFWVIPFGVLLIWDLITTPGRVRRCNEELAEAAAPAPA